MDHSSREPVLESGNRDSMVPSSNFDGLSSGIKQSFHGSIHQGISFFYHMVSSLEGLMVEMVDSFSSSSSS